MNFRPLRAARCRPLAVLAALGPLLMASLPLQAAQQGADEAPPQQSAGNAAPTPATDPGVDVDRPRARRVPHDTSAPTAPQATLAGPELDLGLVVREAVAASPSVAAAEHRWAAALAVPERLRDLPDPTLRTGFYGVPFDTLNPFQGQLRVQYMQGLPYPGTLERRGRVAEREAERLDRGREVARVRVAAAARRAYWELYFAHRAQEIHHGHLALVRELSTSAEELYATAQVPQENVLRALVELTELFGQLADVEAGIGVARANLNAILHRPPDAALGVPGRAAPATVTAARNGGGQVPGLQLADLIAAAAQRNPQLAAAEAAVRREEARVERERHEAKPDFDVMGEWWTQSDGMGGRFERWAVLVTVGLPWVHDDKYTAAVDEAMAARRATEADRLALLDEVRWRVAAAWERLRAAARIAELYRTSVLPQSEQSLQAARASYEADTADFVTLIDNERTLLMNRLALARAEADVGIARADLLEAIGVVDADGTVLAAAGAATAPAPGSRANADDDASGKEVPDGRTHQGGESVDTEPTGAEPTGAEPTDTEPTDTEPTSTEPTGTEPTDTEPTGTEPTGTEPAVEPTDGERSRR